VITVGGAPIYNWDGRGYGHQTMIGCMQHSLNVCLAWVATQLGPERFYKYMDRFGIGHRSNIDVADEVIWPFRTPGSSNWYEADLGANAYGQGVAVTPIQLITAISSMANDGKIMAPHLLKAIITPDWQYATTPQVIGQPVTAETAHTITEMLATSLEEEASTALVDGYRMAGKTGTGSIPFEGSYLENQTNTSFVGWGPVDDPRFVVYIWLERPSSSIWASIVCAPIFHDVVQELVFQMNIPPDEIRAKLYGK
jgi:cell division protein FtsI/penicillin-binding protein 2